MAAENANKQPWANNQVRIAVLVVAAIAVGLVLFFVLHHSKHKHHHKIVTSRIGPISFTEPELKAQAFTLKTPIYWAGTQAGYHYEFTRSTKGYLYIRYLPSGTPVKAPGKNFLIVSTYPFFNAYGSLKKYAKKKALKGPGGSVIYIRPKATNVLMAFPGVDYEIEIYDPSPAIALSTAQSGNIKPVPKH